MKKPYPHGISKERLISRNTLKALKVDELLAGVPVVEYSDLEKVIDHYLASHQYGDPDTAFKNVVTMLTKISSKHRNLSIKTFVGITKKFYHYLCNYGTNSIFSLNQS